MSYNSVHIARTCKHIQVSASSFTYAVPPQNITFLPELSCILLLLPVFRHRSGANCHFFARSICCPAGTLIFADLTGSICKVAREQRMNP